MTQLPQEQTERWVFLLCHPEVLSVLSGLEFPLRS